MKSSRKFVPFAAFAVLALLWLVFAESAIGSFTRNYYDSTALYFSFAELVRHLFSAPVILTYSLAAAALILSAKQMRLPAYIAFGLSAAAGIWASIAILTVYGASIVFCLIYILLPLILTGLRAFGVIKNRRAFALGTAIPTCAAAIILFFVVLIGLINEYGYSNGFSFGAFVFSAHFMLALELPMLMLAAAGFAPFECITLADEEAPVTDSVMESLEKIARLHAQGALTDEEFARQKAALLSKL